MYLVAAVVKSPLGTGHYLWPGGRRKKWGGATKIFCWTGSGLGKKLRRPEWTSKYFSLEKFRRSRGISSESSISYNLPSNKYKWQTSFQWNFIYDTLSGHRKIIAWCRVGRKFFRPRTEWASKLSPVKCCFPPPPPPVIKIYRSLKGKVPVISFLRDIRRFHTPWLTSYRNKPSSQ